MAPFLGKFLQHLERTRGNSARTRNNRLAAIHAFFRYVAVSEPGLAWHCQRILAMPSKRYDRGPVAFVTEEEASALVAAPNPKTWIGKRDRALLLVVVQTGLRNSEITSLRRQDVELGTGSHVPLSREGPQDAMYAAPSGRHQDSEGMDVTTRRKAGRSCVPKFQRRAPQRRRLTTTCCAAPCHSTPALSHTRLQNSNAAHPPSRRSHGHALTKDRGNALRGNSGRKSSKAKTCLHPNGLLYLREILMEGAGSSTFEPLYAPMAHLQVTGAERISL